MIKKILEIIIYIILISILIFAMFQRFYIPLKQKYYNNSALKNKSQYTIMCLGESTTAGQYPIQLQKILNEKYPNKFSVIDCGIPGTTLETILELLDENINKYKPNITVCMMGSQNNLTVYNEKINNEIIKKELKNNLKIYKFFISIRKYILDIFKNKNINIKNEILQYKKQDEKKDEIKKLEETLLKYCYKGDIVNAEKVSKKILEKDPLNESAIFTLARLYHDNIPNKKDESYKLSMFAINNNVGIFRIGFYILAVRYRISKNIALDDLIEKVLNEDVDYREIHKLAALFYVVKPFLSDYKKEQLLNKIMKKQNDRTYGFIAINLLEQKKYKEAKEYFDKAEEIRLNFPDMKTYNLYKLIVKKLIDNNINVICMQYPIRSIEPLKEQLKNEPYYYKINFISNEQNFKDMLIKKNYDDIFFDQIAGDFGHCTYLGNTIIAENIVKTLERLIN